ncbi:MAG: hypothetical protein Q4A15_05425, partial [Prevotellaceae bacterium]|nr:hypothetical protein [Prevotellaceae bacterium]
QASESVAKEKKHIQDLEKVIHDESQSYNVRKRAIEDMQTIVPDYHASLTTEGKLINDNTEAVKAYIKMLSLQAEAEAAATKLTEAKAAKKKWLEDETNADRALKVKQAIAAYNKQHGAFYVPEAGERSYSSPEEAAMDLFGLSPTVFRVVKETIDELEGEVNTYQSIIDEVEKKIAEVKRVQAEAVKANANSNGDSQNSETKEEKKLKEALLAIDAEYDKKAAALKKAYIQGDIKSEVEYTDKLASIEMDRLKAKLEVAGLEEAQRAELLDKLMSAEIKIRQKLDDMVARKKELSYDEQLQQLIDNFNEQEQYINDAYDMGIIPTIERKEEYLLALNENYRVQKKAILEKMAEDERKAAEERKKIAEESAKKEREAYEAQMDKYKSMAEEIADIFGDLGEDIAEALWGDDSKKAWKDAAKSFLIDALSMLEKYIMIKQAQIMADAVASSSTLIDAAPALAKAALKMAGIKAAFGLAKGAVNSFDVGGFTGAGRWNEPRGIVHADEFVANRHATHNPNVLPVLGLIDAAQRSGSIRNLSGEDIAAVALSTTRQASSAPASPIMAQQSIPVDALLAMMARVEAAMKDASDAYKKPSKAYVYVKGKGGIEEAQNLASLMDNNASR